MFPQIENGTHIVLNDGHKMPLVGLGCWLASKKDICSAVETALNSGYKMIDTAYVYLNEEGVGQGIKNWGGKRGDIFLVTKLPLIGMNGGQVEYFLRKSLHKLGVDYVDLYLIHAPMALKYVDDDTIFPLADNGELLLNYATDHLSLWKEMEAVREKGLARSIGVSNFSAAQIRRLIAAAKIPPAVNQIEMNVEFQQREMQKYCNEAGVALTSYASLGSPGRKNTKYEAGCTIPNLLNHPVVGVVASLHKVTPAQVLLRFFVQQGIVVIPKSVTKERIETNLKILDWKLSDQSMDALRTLERGEVARSFLFIKGKGTEKHPECPVRL